MAGLLGEADDPCVVIGRRYELRDRIGRGATATVYRALDRTLDREVALKLLHPGELEVADHEAAILAQIRHRNVLGIHAGGARDPGAGPGDASGRRFLALELIEGRDLRTWLQQRPSPRAIVDCYVAAGRGLSAVHRHGFVHRDFKPSNVLVDTDGRAVVIDFGLARALEHPSERAPVRVADGTLAYMAPERLAGQPEDPRADQFGFCVALWEALAGANPFSGANACERHRSIAQGPAHVDRLLDAGVGPAVVAALTRGLAFDPDDRFAQLDDLLERLAAPFEPARAARRPLSRSAEVGARPTLMAIAIAATFMLGWGLAPEGLTVEPAFSNLDPTADAALTILESAGRHAEAGRVDVAVNELMYAAQLIEGVDKGGESFCAFAHATPRIAEQFERHRAGSQARLAYAIAIRYAQFCPDLDAGELKLRREAAHAITWVEQHKPALSQP